MRARKSFNGSTSSGLVALTSASFFITLRFSPCLNPAPPFSGGATAYQTGAARAGLLRNGARGIWSWF